VAVIVAAIVITSQQHENSNGPQITLPTSQTQTAQSPETSAAAAPKSDVRVYNISSREGVAGRTADQLKQGGYNVTEVGNLLLHDVSATTVYFGNAPGERETADAVGQLLKAPVVPRTAEVADQPPGVIVVVAG
jgi:hypothetical protein